MILHSSFFANMAHTENSSKRRFASVSSKSNHASPSHDSENAVTRPYRCHRALGRVRKSTGGIREPEWPSIRRLQFALGAQNHEKTSWEIEHSES